MSLSRDARWGIASILLLLGPALGVAQEREVVSKEVSVGRAGASLSLEFADGGTLAASLADGSVLVDGRDLGAYAPGDALDLAWRRLLGELVALENGPLARLLRAWTPPGSLEGEALDLARRLDQALDLALEPPPAPDAPDAPATPAGAGLNAAVLRAVVDRDPAALAALGEAVRDWGGEMRVHVGEDVMVAQGETVSGNLLVVRGDVRVEGRVEGSVMVLDGALELAEGGLVNGDVQLLDARLEEGEGPSRARCGT